MSYKVQQKQPLESQIVDPFVDSVSAPLKINSDEVKKKVLEILRTPSKVDAKELVQRATYGNVNS